MVKKKTRFILVSEHKLEFSNICQIKCHENPSRGTLVVPSGGTDMTRVTVVFLKSDVVPKSRPHKLHYSETKSSVNISTWNAYFRQVMLCAI